MKSLLQMRHDALLAARWIIAVTSLALGGCVCAGVSPASAPPAAAAAPFDIHWESDARNWNVEVIWRTEIDRAGAMAVGGETVVICGRDSEQVKGRSLGLSKQTGKINWSVTHDHIPERVHDMVANITSTPFIDGDRVYYVSNRGELCCLQLSDGHVNWMLDMPKTLDVFKRDPGDAVSQAPSPIVVGNIVYCVTGNGADDEHKVPAPEAPSFLAVNKLTGKVIWSSNAPGKNIRYGQWSTPALENVDGAPEILFPGGDGALYAFDPIKGTQLWKVDCSGPIDAKLYHSRDFISAPPLIVGQVAYVSPARDCESSRVGQRLLAINLRTHSIRWSATPDGYSGTMGPMAFANGTVYAASIVGTVVAINADTGVTRWTRGLGDKETITITGGVCLHDKKLYITTQDGDLIVLSASTGKTLAQCNLGSAGVGTPVVVGNQLFVITRNYAWALRLPDESGAK